MKSSLNDLQPWVSGAIVASNAKFNGVCIDSRRMVAGSLFVALKGDQFDGHAFVGEAVAKGAAAVVVERLPEGLKGPAMVVPNTRTALGEIARHWRRQFSMPIIGVTGSNGKTTIKEMIASILSAALGNDQCLATHGNFNNDIGVPLTVLRMEAKHKAAVIEMGTNHPGEIAVLTAIAQPTLGLINNAQRDHQQYMISVEAVAQENGAVIKALPANGIAVFPADDQYTPLWAGYASSVGQRKVMTFGLSGNPDVTCTYQPNIFGSDLQVTAGKRQFQVRLSAAGEHNVRNALAATACALAVGISVDAVVKGLEAFVPVNGRLQRKTARCGALIIDDTYNANPDSVRAAIDVLAQMAAPRVLVLGDMGEVGDKGKQFHEEIGAYARGRRIERLITLGNLAAHASGAFGAHAKHFNDINAMQQALDGILTAKTTALIKGSRFMEMERVVQYLVGEPAQGAH